MLQTVRRRFTAVRFSLLRSGLLSFCVILLLGALLPALAAAQSPGSPEGNSSLSCGCGQYPGTSSHGDTACTCQAGLVPAGTYGCAPACPTGSTYFPPYLNPSQCADCARIPQCGNDKVFVSGRWTDQCKPGRVSIPGNRRSRRAVCPSAAPRRWQLHKSVRRWISPELRSL